MTHEQAMTARQNPDAAMARRPPRSWPIIALYLIVVALFVATLARYYRPDTGFTYLIAFGGNFGESMLPAVAATSPYVHDGSWGYDGQFYAQLATVPLLRDPQIDVTLDLPAYRARRIFFCFTAYALGLGRPALVLQAWALQNAVAWLLLAWLLCRWCPPTSLRAWLVWSATLTTHGVLASVRLTLLDAPSLLLLALAVMWLEVGRPWLAALTLGAAGLARETNLLGTVMGIDVGGRSRQRWLVRAAWLAVAILPLALWLDYLRSIYVSTLSQGSGALDLPLTGLWVKLGEVSASVRGGVSWQTLLAISPIVSLLTQAIWLVTHPATGDHWWRLGMAYLCLMMVLGPAVWEGLPGAAPRALVPMTAAFNVLLLRRWSATAFVLGNLLSLAGIDVLARSIWY